MNFVPEYILKLSISLAGIFLFYYFILRRLTFHNYNRWYLLGYTLLSFLIPFINISPVLQQNNLQGNGVVNWVPVINSNAVKELPAAGWGTWSIWQWAIAIIAVGMFVMLSRLAIQLVSFKKMLRKAEPIGNVSMNLYQVNDNIIPFSFGNAIYINRHLHDEDELQEIIRHEFVHVKQRHSIDIIWAELLCIINWYNPFAWLLKKAIRQNLEFIADHKVLENGIDKRSYQYLLLKVIGNNQYSIANQFNFSSLKKRIAMMNKTKSAKRQLIRLLFVLPATAILLLAFRTKWDAAAPIPTGNKKIAVLQPATAKDQLLPLIAVDMQRDTTIKKKLNSKGYFINVKNINGEDRVVIKDKVGKEVKSIPVKEWDANEEQYEKIYGEATAVPPATPVIPAIAETVLPVKEPTVIEVAAPVSMNLVATTPPPVKIVATTISPVKITTSTVSSAKIATVISSPVKIATTVKPVVAVSTETVVEVPSITAAISTVPLTASVVAKLPDNVKKVQINNNKVTLWLKNGKKEIFDLNNAEEKKTLEKKYGIYAGTPVEEIGSVEEVQEKIKN
jgi:beta-lactamase regulating signal transducer with metallopeptidase domain